MKRDIRYDVLRIIACFNIIVLHTSAAYLEVVPIESSEFAVMRFYAGITTFAVPVFFMLSGHFLLDPSKEMTAKQWGKKIARLLAGFFVWSSFYAFQSVLFNGFVHGWDTVTREMWSDAMVRLLSGHLHMWFLLDLLGFYLLLPILRKISEDIRLVGYFLLLWVLVRFVCETLLPIMGLLHIYSFISHIHLYALLGYIGYFFAGYYLGKAVIPKVLVAGSYILGVGGVAFAVFYTLMYCRKFQEYDGTWCSPSSINILFYSAAVFILFTRWKVPQRLGKAAWISQMSRNCFFVYMFHMFLLEKLNMLGINATTFSTVIAIPVISAGVFGVSMLAGWLAGKIPWVGKILTFR